MLVWVRGMSFIALYFTSSSFTFLCFTFPSFSADDAEELRWFRSSASRKVEVRSILLFVLLLLLLLL